MHIFTSMFAKPVIAFATAASLLFGGSVIAHNSAQASSSDINKNKTDVEHTEKIEHRSTPTLLDIVIGAGGKVLVHGAIVTGVSNTAVNAQTAWGSSIINWVVQSSNAKVFAKHNSTSTSSLIETGDSVNFSGSLASSSAFTVDAQVLRDTSR